MKYDFRRAIAIIVAAGCGLAAAGVVTAGTWNSSTKQMVPAYGEAVAYDRSDCKAPNADGAYIDGYFGFVDKPGVSYPSLGSFNDMASCIVVGPKTRARIYQHTNFGGKYVEYPNPSTQSVRQVVLSGWWNNTMSSIKVWKM